MTNDRRTIMEEVSKKAKRLESKKRKAKAFLELVKDSEKVTKDSVDECDAPAKVLRLSNNGGAPKDGSSITPEGDTMNNVRSSFKGTDDELAELRRIKRERQKAAMEKPKLYLLLDELQMQHSKQMSEDLSYKELPPLFMLDLQHLLLYAAQGNVSSFKPRWCRLLRVSKMTSVVVIVLDAVSSYEYQMYTDCFPRLNMEFSMSVDMVCPEQYDSSVHQDLFNVPLSNYQLSRKNVRLSIEARNLLMEVTRPPGYTPPIQPKNSQPIGSQGDATSAQDAAKDQNKIENFINSGVIHKNDSFDRTSLLLNSSQMIAEDFPVPINYGKLDSYKNFVFSKDSYKTVHSQSPMFAVDCEMCVTSVRKFEVTRVSVVNEDLETVYDTYVKPYNRIIDYVTRYSGITKAILDPVQTRLSDVQKFLRKVLPPDAILCGQSLKGDLIALQMFHPYVIDTSVIFNLSGQRVFKPGLKKLSAHFLGKVIQDSMDGHSSVEDAVTTMELVQLKLKQSPDFGDIVNGGEVFPQTSNYKASAMPHGWNASQRETTKEETLTTPPGDGNGTQSSDKTVNAGSDTKSSDTNDAIDSDPLCSCKESDQDPCKYCQNKKLQQRKAFFSKAGSQVFNSFFSLMEKQKKIVGLIDKAETIDLYKNSSMTAVPTTCDRSSKSSGKSLVQFHDFVYMNFPSYREVFENGTEEEKMYTLRKQDKRISKVMKHVRANSLVAIVMSGRCHGNQNYSAKTFVKVT